MKPTPSAIKPDTTTDVDKHKVADREGVHATLNPRSVSKLLHKRVKEVNKSLQSNDKTCDFPKISVQKQIITIKKWHCPHNLQFQRALKSCAATLRLSFRQVHVNTSHKLCS